MYSYDHCFTFGDFHLFPTQQRLLRGEIPIALGSRAMEILVVLIEQAGQIVDKETLTRRAWPTTFVEESNLRAQIAALRRALGDGKSPLLIANVPGRGYRFTGPVVQNPAGASATVSRGRQQLPSADRRHNLPSPLARMIGRRRELATISGMLKEHRFVTIAGPGGIGKTTIAIAAAYEMLSDYRDGIFFVEIDSLLDARLLPGAIASVVGLTQHSEASESLLVEHLCSKHALIVLDNCERVIEATAMLAERLLKHAPSIHLLTTSREALRASGEQVFRLEPLQVPPISSALTGAEAMSYSAVQLFVERVASVHRDFVLCDEDAPLVAEICRRLDGIALAIELGAGRVDAFGIHGLATLLDDRFRLLTLDRRTALPRHQTLSATLDWSYSSLPHAHQVMLRRLGVFARTFTAEAACVVAGDIATTEGQLLNLLADLVAKSLVVADVNGSIAYYRLLHTTRAFALSRLHESGDAESCALRHARLYLDRLRDHATESPQCFPPGSHAARNPCEHEIDNVRAALEWAWATDGQLELALELTAASIPLWLSLSLFDEYAFRVKQALDALSAQQQSDTAISPRTALRLWSAHATSLTHRVGGGDDMTEAWRNVLLLSEALDEKEQRFTALWGIWASQRNTSQYASALTVAQQLLETAESINDPFHVAVGERVVGTSLFYLGQLDRAHRHIEKAISRFMFCESQPLPGPLQFDQLIASRSFQAQILLLRGLPDHALAVATHNVEQALDSRNITSIAYALCQGACPVSLYAGDVSTAKYFVDMFLSRSATSELQAWHELARCFEGILSIRTSGSCLGLPILHRAISAILPGGRGPLYTMARIAFCDALLDSDDTHRLSIEIDDMLERAQQCNEIWCMPELLRIKGATYFGDSQDKDVSAGEEYLVRSHQFAKDCGARLWEIRSATVLAKHWSTCGRGADARSLLVDALGSIPTTTDAPDLVAARIALDGLE
ncbi:ATP-binding protein [Burkholderia sp. RF2-non_BP3]|uniref:ATP-binding protein n=1 Tax=Burkholderia sp. RF2-non_BP3 TaxID=1637844 RepID=UPI0007589F82|nr:winged helix-turn-helix domain-containing protein [Burkholderia sp. RF2-non_BP3]KUY59288.1 transcriptional regulator [Burkholderia sp. RF2-non_BP3]